MKTLAYLDCPTGIAGDMCLGALVSAGVPLSYLETHLARLGLQNEFRLQAETVLRSQQAATRVQVERLPHHEEHRHEGHHNEGHHNEGHRYEEHRHDTERDRPFTLPSHGGRQLLEIEAIIQQANLPERASAWSLAIFRLLAKAEAAVHGIAPEQVHFHEVGAVDAIVDIVGTCLGLDWLNIDRLICSPLPTGGGTVRCEHGLLPVPAPAVLNMMATAQMPVYSNGLQQELVTPTGCAIAATLAESFGPPPRFTLQKIGLGAGSRDLKLPNILRLWIGTVETLPAAHRSAVDHSFGLADPSFGLVDPSFGVAIDKTATETIIELQTQIDDSSPQIIGYVFEQLFAAGAVDVFTQAVTMKKNRLGTLLTVLCPMAATADCETVIFRETTTLGIRRQQQQRSVLAREMVQVSTPYGKVAIKVARSGETLLNLQPEYEDCANLARSQNIPLQQVYQAAMGEAIARF
jgi:pyridinium-3,5-bisthiocarboxylic acid mononucleotide nickel chelatase